MQKTNRDAVLWDKVERLTKRVNDLERDNKSLKKWFMELEEKDEYFDDRVIECLNRNNR